MTALAVEAGAVCEPLHVHIPERAGSFVRAVEAVGAKIGRRLDPTQRLAVDVITSAKADGSPATLAAALICPRQNLKTYCLELVVLARLLRPGGDRLAVWSAHEVSTAQETFRAFAELAEGEDERGRPLYPWFRERVQSISRATGRESITFVRRLPSGRKETARLKFKARIKSGGRGLAGDCVILDEAFALEPAHMGSLLPILSTKAKGQIIYGSSAPHETSLVLHDVIKRGRAGLMAYAEWRAAGSWEEPGCALDRCMHELGTPGCALDNVDLALTCNPAAHHGRITRQYLANERIELAAVPREYARERLGWAEEPGGASASITPAMWAARADEASAVTEGVPRVFALDVSPDRRWSSVAVAGLRADGGRHLGLIEHEPGDRWVVGRIVELRERHAPAAIVLDGASPAAALLPDLIDAGMTVRSERRPWGDLVVTTAGDMAAACGGLESLLKASPCEVWHRGDVIVSRALESAGSRVIGDGGWGWARKSSDADITPIVALTLASWGLAKYGQQGESVY